MGETVSTLVFRPPPPTRIKPSKYFFIEVPAGTESPCLSEGCSIVPNATNCELDDSIATQLGPHKIPAFFIRRRGATHTFLFSHGNAEDLGMMYGRMKEMARVLGVNVLAYDYTGYGLSSGQPSEKMCYRNIEAAYNYLRMDRKIPSSQIILYGRSLGSGPSCHLAKRTAEMGESVAGLILHSPFLSIYRIVMDVGFSLVGDMFRNKDNAPGVRCPVLIIHGTKDEVVPFWHGDELLRSFPPQCRAEPFWVNGLGHNSIELHAKVEYTRRILSFLNRYVNGKKGITQQDLTERLRPDKNYRPMAVPEDERYHPDKGLSHSGKVYINRTWVQHGKDIINEAIRAKVQHKKNIRKVAIVQRETNNKQLVKSTNHGKATQRERTTHEILQELKMRDKRESPVTELSTCVSDASRFIITRDSQVEDDDSGDDEVEIEWKHEAFSGSNLSFENSIIVPMNRMGYKTQS